MATLKKFTDDLLTWVKKQRPLESADFKKVQTADGIKFQLKNKPKVKDVDFLGLKNGYTATIPAFSACEVTNTDEDGQRTVTRPTANNLNPAIVVFSMEEIPVGSTGIGISAFDGEAFFTYDSLPVVGDNVGTQTDSFIMKKDNTGFIYQGTFDTDDSLGYVRPSASGGDTYVGMHKVIVNPTASDKIIVLGEDLTGAYGSIRPYKNIIYIGLYNVPVPTYLFPSAISASGWVYIEIEYIGGSYIPTYKFLTSEPTVDPAKLREIIAYVEWDGTSSTIKNIYQILHNQLHFTGRFY